jgi:galactonate dehydratase
LPPNDKGTTYNTGGDVRIENVESIVVEGAHYVRIRTDDGTSGLGQSAAWAYPEAVHAIVETFTRHLVGKDPLRIEHHWQHLYRMGPFRGSILGGALSAVDIALWDIKGKHLQAPIWELLGGRYRDRVRLYLLIAGNSVDDLAAVAAQAVADGFTAVKLDPLPAGFQDMILPRLHATVSERLMAARETVGLDVDLIIELHRKLTPLQFSTVAPALEQVQPLFVEDPIQIDSIAAQAALARRWNLPIGNGERLHTIWEFNELLAAGGTQFVRPDLGLAGGLSQCKKIAAVAEAYHAPVCTHNFLGPVLTAASIHLDIAIPNFVAQEYGRVDEGPVAEAFSGVLKRDGGYMPVPEVPGLGLTLDESKLISIWPQGWDLTQGTHRSDGSVAFAP